MEEQLKNIREKMDAAVFQAASFNKQAVHQKLKRRRRWLPSVVAALFFVIVAGYVALELTNEQSAGYKSFASDLDGVYLQNFDYGSFMFSDGKLTVRSPQWISGKSVEEDKVLHDAQYENVVVKAQDDFYYIYDGETLIFTFQKIAPRMLVDQNGIQYTTPIFLGDKYTLTVSNASSVEVRGAEIYMKTSELEETIFSDDLQFSIPRQAHYNKVTLTLTVHTTSGESYTLPEPIILEGAYEDTYTFTLTGDSLEELQMKE
ncbi:MAG: hypothetical protein ACI33M_02190 [Lysinibacillus sp.]